MCCLLASYRNKRLLDTISGTETVPRLYPFLKKLSIHPPKSMTDLIYDAWSLKWLHRGFLFNHSSTSFRPFTLSSSRSDFNYTAIHKWQAYKNQTKDPIHIISLFSTLTKSLTSLWERLSVLRLGTLLTKSVSSSSLWMRLLLRFKQVSWQRSRQTHSVKLIKLLDSSWDFCLYYNKGLFSTEQHQKQPWHHTSGMFSSIILMTASMFVFQFKTISILWDTRSIR